MDFQLAATWFPPNQMSSATAIGVFGNQVDTLMSLIDVKDDHKHHDDLHDDLHDHDQSGLSPARDRSWFCPASNHSEGSGDEHKLFIFLLIIIDA